MPCVSHCQQHQCYVSHTASNTNAMRLTPPVTPMPCVSHCQQRQCCVSHCQQHQCHVSHTASKTNDVSHAASNTNAMRLTLPVTPMPCFSHCQQHQCHVSHTASNTNVMCLTPTATSSFPERHNVTYSTPIPCRAVLLKKPIIPQATNKFPASYGTRRFITVFTTAPQSYLSQDRCIQFTQLHLISLISIFFASDSFTKSTDAFLFSAICARCPARHILLDTLFKNSIQLKLIISKVIHGTPENPSRSVLAPAR